MQHAYKWQRRVMWCAALIFLGAAMLLFSILNANAQDGAGAPWLQRALRDVGRNPTGWKHQWCAKWLDDVTPGHGGNLAAGYARYGRPTGARVGAIAVMPHHVGIVKEVGNGYVVLVSGNHSGRSGARTVGLGRYSMSRIMTFRWPA